MTTETRQKGASDRRQSAREKAREVLTVLGDARVELGRNPSYNALAYYVTGRGILTQLDKRWSGQTIKDVTEIDTIQLESIAASEHALRPVIKGDTLERWRKWFEDERKEVAALGQEIRDALGW